MGNVRFHNDTVYWMESLTLGPVKVYQIGDLCCKSDYEVEEHTQICYEISLGVSGKGCFWTENAVQTVTKGCIYVNVPGERHHLRSDRDDPLRLVYLGFWFNEEHPKYGDYKQIKELFDHLHERMTFDKFDIFSIFSKTLGEMISSEPLMLEMLETYITQIIIKTYRTFQYTKANNYNPLTKDKSEDNLVYDIINYIDRDICNVNQLSNLSREFGYSYPYLSQVFSSHMGQSIQQYFRKHLFNKAIDLMKEGKSITEISSMLGYNTMYSFSRAFKNYFRITPSNYRKKVMEEAENAGKK